MAGKKGVNPFAKKGMEKGAKGGDHKMPNGKMMPNNKMMKKGPSKKSC